MSKESELAIIPRFTRVLNATYAALPVTGLREGELGYATDRRTLYRWSGLVWEDISIYSDSGVIGAIPAAAGLPEGSLFYSTDTLELFQVQAGVWAAIISEYLPKLPYFASAWQIPGWSGIGVPGGSAITTAIHYCPIYVPARTTFDRAFIHVSAGVVGSVVGCHLFRGNTDGSPGALVADLGDFDSGAIGPELLTINQTLIGFYYLAVKATLTGVSLWHFGADGHKPVHGISLTQPAIAEAPEYIVTSVVAAWADPAPAPTLISTTILGSMVVLRET